MADDLHVAAAAARRLATTVSTIRALRAEGATRPADWLSDDLDSDSARGFFLDVAAIEAVEEELRRTRTAPARLGDVVAPAAHEATVEMVLALNRERLGLGNPLGRKPIVRWPDIEEVLVEIDLESSRARFNRQQAVASNRDDAESAAPQYVTRDQIAAMVGRSKDKVMDWFNDDADSPEPAVEGGGGKAYQYIWSEVRPWLEAKSGRKLPIRFPSLLSPT